MNKLKTGLLALGSLLLIGCNSAKDRTESTIHNVFVITAEPAEGSLTRYFAGRIEEARSVGAAFKTAGPIERIHVKEGDRVRRGQLIAELDSTDYLLGINQLRIQNDQLNDEFSRITKLYATGSVSDNDYQKAEAGIKQLAYQLALNENKLGYCRLYAPSDGVVTDVKYEPGELVDAGMPIVELMDNTHLEIVVDLPVSDYLRRENFNNFSGSSPLRPGSTFPLQMLSLTPRADNNQLYKLRLAVPAGVTELTPGMNVTVNIRMTDTGNDAVKVPASAVVADNDGSTAVFIFNSADSTVTLSPVTVTGTGADGTLTVNSGLSAGASIVRAGVHHLVNGEKVRVIKPASDSNVGNLL